MIGKRWVVAGVALAVAAVWFPAVFGGFCSDDVYLIQESELLHRPGAERLVFTQDLWRLQAGGWQSDYWRPVSQLSFVVDDRFHGESARAYHATNVALHAGVAALLALWLVELGCALPVAAAAAALFGVLPAADGTVAWIAGRTDALAALFLLAYLLLDARRARTSSRAGATAALALALLSKETAIVALPLALFADTRRGTPLARALRARWDQLAVVALWFAARAAVLGTPVTHGQAVMPLAPEVRALALPHLLGLFAVPWWGRVDYAPGLTTGVLLPGALAGLAVAALLGVLAWRSRGVDASPRNPRAPRPHAPSPRPVPVLLAGAALCLAPVAAAVLLKATIAQRLLYVPALFVVPALVTAGFGLARSPRGRAIAWGAVAVVGVLWTATSIERIPRWASSAALWESASREPHASGLVFSNLANSLHDEGRLLAAWDALGQAIPTDTSDVGLRQRALLLNEIGCHDLAVADFAAAMQRNAGFERTVLNYASTLGEMARYDDAIAVLTDFRNRFGAPAFIERKLARLAKERDDARTAVPAPATPPELLCGSLDTARARLHDASFLAQRSAVRLKGGVLQHAFVLATAALEADPNSVPAKLALARWNAASGQRDAARALVGDVLARDPGNASARKLAGQLGGGPRVAIAGGGMDPGGAGK